LKIEINTLLDQNPEDESWGVRDFHIRAGNNLAYIYKEEEEAIIEAEIQEEGLATLDGE
jgi:hypothetical protein